MKLKEHELHMKSKREELKKKEEDYYAKRDEMFDRIKRLDQKHIQEGLQILDKIEDKFNRSQDIKLRQIKKRAHDAHRKNVMSQKRLENYYKLEEQKTKEREDKLLKQRLKVEKKIHDHAIDMAKRKEKIKNMNK